jgi:hypothetical protein
MTITCVGYISSTQGSRIAFVDIALPESGVILKGCHLHRSATGKQWLAWPGVQTGRGFSACAKFMATVEHTAWQQEAPTAVGKFLAGVDTKDCGGGLPLLMP